MKKHRGRKERGERLYDMMECLSDIRFNSQSLFFHYAIPFILDKP